MTAAGWVLMGLSWLLIGSLVVFCVHRVLRSDPPSQEDPTRSAGMGD